MCIHLHLPATPLPVIAVLQVTCIKGLYVACFTKLLATQLSGVCAHDKFEAIIVTQGWDMLQKQR